MKMRIHSLLVATAILGSALPGAAQSRDAALSAAARVASGTSLSGALRQSLAAEIASTFEHDLQYDAGQDAYTVSGCDNTGVSAELVDLNGDATPEVLLQASGLCLGGMSGAQSWIFVQAPSGQGWRANLGEQGGLVPLRTRTGGWLDLVVAGPGFCHPVWRWSGGAYSHWCNVRDRAGSGCGDPCPPSVTLRNVGNELPPFRAGGAGGGKEPAEAPDACRGCAAEGGIRAEVYPARDTAAYGYVETFFRRTDLLGKTAEALAGKIALPAYLHLAAGECGEKATGYYQPQRMVMLCFEQVDAIFRAFPASAGTLDQRSAAVASAVTFVLHRELAHALIATLGLQPGSFGAPGAEPGTWEDAAADQLAALAAMRADPDAALAAGIFLLRENASLGEGATLGQAGELLARLGAVEGEHSADAERFVTLACWSYGASPSARASLGAALPAARRSGCADEYRAIGAGWSRALAAHATGRGGSAVPAAARLQGRWRFPPLGAPRVAGGSHARMAERDRHVLGGRWSFEEELGPAGSPVRCRSAGKMEVRDEEGPPTASFGGGLESCPQLFPFEEDASKGGTSALFFTERAVYFLVLSCAYSGVLDASRTRLAGRVRCTSSSASGPTSVTGTWAASRGS